MTIQNNVTKKQYEVTKEGWESLGKRKKTFTVINFKDSEEIISQTVGNAAAKTGLTLGKEKKDEIKVELSKPKIEPIIKKNK